MDKCKKVIWLVNFHAKPPHLEGYLKTIKFAQYLNENEYDAYIFSSNNFHNRDERMIDDNSSIDYILKKYDKLTFIHIKTLSYKNSSLLRVLSLIQFSVKLFILKKHFIRPDAIIHTAYIPFDNLVYYTAKAFKAKYFIDILDLWPESFVDVGLIKKNNPILSIAYYLEKWLYKRADGIIFCMQGGKDYIIEKKWDKENGGYIDLNNVHWISNGVDIIDYNANLQKYKLEDEDLQNDNLIKVIYMGSIRLANNLINLINAAALLKEYENIKFFIFGDGIDRNYLEYYCIENNIKNVAFKQRWIDPKYVPYVLSRSSINILNYKQGLGKYGGSASKLFQYLASGKPICSNIKMSYCIIDKFNLGISESFQNAQEYSNAIISLSNLTKTEQDAISNKEKEILKEYDYKFLTRKLISIIER